LEIDAGTYVVLRVGQTRAMDAAAMGQPVPLQTPNTAAEWDTSPDDLGMLMALAAVREVGGTLTLETVGEERLISVYLPSAPL
jgi:hypothetical protein